MTCEADYIEDILELLLQMNDPSAALGVLVGAGVTILARKVWRKK